MVAIQLGATLAFENISGRELTRIKIFHYLINLPGFPGFLVVAPGPAQTQGRLLAGLSFPPVPRKRKESVHHDFKKAHQLK